MRCGQSIGKVCLLALGTALTLAAQTTINGGRIVRGDWDAGDAATTRPVKTGTALPATCSVGEQFFRTDAGAGQNLYFCTSTNTWTQMTGAGGGGGAPTSSKYILQTADGALPNAQALGALTTGVLKNTATTGVLSIATGSDLPSHTHAAAEIGSGILTRTRGGTGADLSGTGGSGQVLKQSTAGGDITVGGLASMELTDSASLERTANKNAANGYAGLDAGARIGKAQAPAAAVYTDAGNTYTAGTQDQSGAGATLPVKAGTSAAAPASCVANKELYIQTDAAAGKQLFLCNGTGDGWNLVGDGTGGTPGGVSRGAILYGNTTPAAAWLAKGAANQVVGYDANDVGPKTIKVTHSQWLPVFGGTNDWNSGWTQPNANTPTASVLGSAPWRVTIAAFADGANRITVSVNHVMPSDWDGSPVTIALPWITGGGANQAVKWDVATGCVGAGDAASTEPSWNAISTQTLSTGASPLNLKIMTFSNVAVTNCSPGELMYIRVERDANDAGDTNTTGASIWGAQLTYKTTVTLE